MGHQHRHDHDRVFRALRLVEGRGMGKRQFVEFRYVVLDPFTVEIDFQRLIFRIHLTDITQIAVEHILSIVVAQLHHAVALSVGVASAAETRPRRVQGLLQGEIQVRGTHNAPLQRQ